MMSGNHEKTLALVVHPYAGPAHAMHSRRLALVFPCCAHDLYFVVEDDAGGERLRL